MIRRLGEFDRIERYFRPLATDPSVALNLIDDAALMTPARGSETVVSTDTIVEGVHFLPDTDPFRLGQKLLRVNLSDMAAMGARPRYYMLSMTLPPEMPESWLHAFTDGLARDQATFDVALAGGDSTQTGGPIVLTITIMGEVPAGQALRRNAGRPGDKVLVSGTIGDGHLGLMAAQGGLNGLSDAALDFLRTRYETPNPRVALGALLAAQGVRAGLDVSDGLVADLGHLARYSGVAATLDLSSVPLSVPAREALAAGFITIDQLVTGGDDYELVFTIPAERHQALVDALKADEYLPNVTVIGELTAIREPAANPVTPVLLKPASGVAYWAVESGWQHR